MCVCVYGCVLGVWGSELCLRLTPGATQVCLMLQNGLPSLSQPPLDVSAVSEAELRGAYYKRAKLLHPDIAGEELWPSQGPFPRALACQASHADFRRLQEEQHHVATIRCPKSLDFRNKSGQACVWEGRGLEAGFGRIMRWCHFPPLQAACAVVDDSPSKVLTRTCVGVQTNQPINWKYAATTSWAQKLNVCQLANSQTLGKRSAVALDKAARSQPGGSWSRDTAVCLWLQDYDEASQLMQASSEQTRQQILVSTQR